jgi:integral membrane sensor domain MASE1
MNFRNLADKKHQFRLVLCGHKAAEAAAVCIVLMVQGQLAEVTAAHLLMASKTGMLAVLPVLGITFTHHARHLINRWTSSFILGICTFAADAVIHQSHYPGEYTEAALTGIGAFALSLLISFTPVGKRIDELAETFLSRHPVAINS